MNNNQNLNILDALNTRGNDNSTNVTGIQNKYLINLGLPKNQFNIWHINLPGLSSKFNELKLMLTSPVNNISIMGISETKFNLNHKTEAFIING